MGQAAYDYNTARRRKAPQTQRKTALRVEKGGKRRLSPLQAALRNAMHLVAAALLTGFAISLLMSEAQLVELNDQIQDAKAQLVSAQSQYTYYNSTLNSKTNITSVEETAGRLGLMKIDQSQITYIRLGESDTLERTQSAVRTVDRLYLQRCREHSWHCKVNQIREACGSARFFRFIHPVCRTVPNLTKARQKAANARCRRSIPCGNSSENSSKNKRPLAGNQHRCPHEPQNQSDLRRSGPCGHGPCCGPCDLQPV